MQDYDACSFEPCFNNATCTSTLRSRDFSCTCLDGFTSADCSVNIDDCIAPDCEAYEVCVDGVNSYTCACPLGFTGPQCAEDIDECASNPCQNGATCRDLVGEYECECVGNVVNLTHITNDERSVFQ